MAVIKGIITLNEIDILEVDVNPASGAGTPAPRGSLASVSTSGSEGFFQKIGPLDTDWTPIYFGAGGGGANGSLLYMNDAGSDNKWLKLNGNHLETSNIIRGLFPLGVRLTGFTFFNKKNNVGGDLELYKNSTLIYTWPIRNKRYAWKTNSLPTLSFNAGDRLSVFCRSVEGQRQIDTPAFFVYFVFTDTTASEGGAQTLVDL
jgi:hypothetical protein